MHKCHIHLLPWPCLATHRQLWWEKHVEKLHRAGPVPEMDVFITRLLLDVQASLPFHQFWAERYVEIHRLQGYLAHKNPPPPRTLQSDYT